MSVWIPVIITVFGAGVSIYSAVSAARSASAAELANENTEKDRNLDAHRRVSNIANEICVRVDYIEEIADDLNREYSDLFSFAGQFGNQKPYVDDVNERVKKAQTIKQRAKEFLGGLTGPMSASTSDFVRRETEFESDISNLNSIRDKIILDLKDKRDQNRTFRERALQR